MGSPSAPSVPDPSKAYEKGIQLDLKYLPQQLQEEYNLRQQYDPLYVQHQQDLQNQFGTQQYDQQLQGFAQLDPTYLSDHDQLGASIGNQLSLGSQLDPTDQGQLEQYVRAAQAARGNTSGNASATAEAYALGDRGRQIQQQRTSNALSFLAAPTIAQQVNAVQPVSADRNASFVNPTAGTQGQNFALQNYQNLLGANALNSQGNPWGSALGGAASGAAAGSSFGPYGALIGGVAGGLGGYFSSDRRLKEHVQWVGRDEASGLNLFDFNYRGQKTRRRGVMSDEVRKRFPHAVTQDARGFDVVNYDAIGSKMQEVI